MTDEKNNEIESLKPKAVDYVASAAKAALCAIPFIGSLLSELAGTTIPNQRIDRIVKFAEVLERRIATLEQEFIRTQFQEETFSDLLEEGLRQAAHSLSDERREYIASLISNSLTSEDIEYQESKHLLKKLDEINDIEVIWLRYYLVPTMNGDNEFREKHAGTLKPVTRVMNSPQPIKDKGTLKDSYKQHLAQLGLLNEKEKGYSLSSLGRFLLREIGLIEESSND